MADEDFPPAWALLVVAVGMGAVLIGGIAGAAAILGVLAEWAT